MINNNAGYAYVINWEQRHAPKALARLWDHGYKVRAAEKGFMKDGTSFSGGSLVVLVGRNLHKPNIHADMATIAEAAMYKLLALIPVEWMKVAIWVLQVTDLLRNQK